MINTDGILNYMNRFYDKAYKNVNSIPVSLYRQTIKNIKQPINFDNTGNIYKIESAINKKITYNLDVDILLKKMSIDVSLTNEDINKNYMIAQINNKTGELQLISNNLNIPMNSNNLYSYLYLVINNNLLSDINIFKNIGKYVRLNKKTINDIDLYVNIKNHLSRNTISVGGSGEGVEESKTDEFGRIITDPTTRQFAGPIAEQVKKKKTRRPKKKKPTGESASDSTDDPTIGKSAVAESAVAESIVAESTRKKRGRRSRGKKKQSGDSTGESSSDQAGENERFKLFYTMQKANRISKFKSDMEKPVLRDYSLAVNKLYDEEYDAKIFCYLNYENFLSSGWGSMQTGIYKRALALFRETELQLISDNEYSNANSTVRALESITGIKDFFMSSNISALIKFGTSEHATALYLKKNGEFIECHYINTGGGINNRDYDIINIDDVEYYDILKRIKISNKNADEFIQLFAPFIYYKYDTISDVDSYSKFIYFLETITPDTDKFIELMPYYNTIYKYLTSGKYNVMLHKLFNEGTLRCIPDKFKIFIRHTDEENQAMHKKIYDAISIYNINKKSFENNIKRGFESIVTHIDTSLQRVYFLPQRAGSCTFRSFLMAYLYHIILVNDDLLAFFNKMYVFVTELNKNLKSIVDTYLRDYELFMDKLSISTIIENMVEDEFITRSDRHNPKIYFDSRLLADLTDKTDPFTLSPHTMHGTLNKYSTTYNEYVLTISNILDDIRSGRNCLDTIKKYCGLYFARGSEEKITIPIVYNDIYILIYLNMYYNSEINDTSEGSFNDFPFTNLKLSKDEENYIMSTYRTTRWNNDVIDQILLSNKIKYMNTNVKSYSYLDIYDNKDIILNKLGIYLYVVHYIFNNNVDNKIIVTSGSHIKRSKVKINQYQDFMNLSKNLYEVCYENIIKNDVLSKLLKFNILSTILPETNSFIITQLVSYLSDVLNVIDLAKFIISIIKEIHNNTEFFELTKSLSITLLQMINTNFILFGSPTFDNYGKTFIGNMSVGNTKRFKNHLKDVYLNYTDNDTIKIINYDIFSQSHDTILTYLSNITGNDLETYKDLSVAYNSRNEPIKIINGTEHACSFMKIRELPKYDMYGYGGGTSIIISIFASFNLFHNVIANKIKCIEYTTDSGTYAEIYLTTTTFPKLNKNHVLRIQSIRREDDSGHVWNEYEYDNMLYDDEHIISMKKYNENRYPFLLFFPKNCYKFIHRNKKNDYTASLYFCDSLTMANKFFVSAIKRPSGKTLDTVGLDIKISDNFLTPLFTTSSYDNLVSLQESFCFYNYVKRKFVLNNENVTRINSIANVCEKIDSRVLESYTKLKNIIQSFYEIIGYAGAHEADDEDNLGIKLTNINIDTRNCSLCDNKNITIMTNDEQISNYIESSFDDADKNLKKFIRDNPVCRIALRDKEKIKRILEHYIKLAKKIRLSAGSKIYYSRGINDDYTIIDLIAENYCHFKTILQMNIYIGKVFRIIDAIDNDITCDEILEINKILTNSAVPGLTNFELCIEILLGISIKDEQWFKYKQMISNSSDDKYHAYHFMMGKGKSSVITPLLVSHFGVNNIVNVIVPTHLVSQTKETLGSISRYIDLKLNILDDVEIKKIFLSPKNNKYDNILPKTHNNVVYLIDEFDYMCNPLQSNFNIISKQIQFNRSDIITNINNIIKHNDTVPDATNKYHYKNQVIDVLNNLDKYVKNVNFGMSVRDKHKRICIPYLRKDSPMEGSSFKSIIITITLTIMYYYLSNYELDEDDYAYILSKRLESVILLISRRCEIDPLLLLSSDTKKTKSTVDATHMSIEAKEEIFLTYINIVLKDLYISTEINNCSFYDIINMDCTTQIGYTGTINIDLPLNSKFSNEIIKDYDEIYGVYFSITGLYNVPNNYHQISSIADITSRISENKYDVLIDACAFLKDLENQDVAELLHHTTGKNVIYITKNDVKMIIDATTGIHTEYDGKQFLNNEIVYYYDQRHIVGTDLKQPTKLNGLVLLDKQNNYTQIAQAIYRMRKLNRGHVVNIGYCNFTPDDRIINETDVVVKKQLIYKMLLDNDKLFLISTKNLSMLQNIKCTFRKHCSKNYAETYLPQLYDHKLLNERSSTNILIRFILKNIFNIDTKISGSFENSIKKIREHLSTIDRPEINILGILDPFISLGKSEIFATLFDINEQQTDVEREDEQDVEMELEMELETIYEINSADYLFMNNLLSYYYVTNPIQCNYYKWYEIVCNNDVHLILSINLFTILPDMKMIYCFVRIAENVFIMENIYNIGFYQSKYPIYTNDGVIINLASVPTENKFSTTFAPLMKINIRAIMNVNISFSKYSGYINMADLALGNFEDAPKKYMTIGNKIEGRKLILILIILYKFYNVVSTSNITQDMFNNSYDPEILFNVLRQYNPETDGRKYEKYIYDHLYNILTINRANRLKSQFKYTFTSISNELMSVSYDLLVKN